MVPIQLTLPHSQLTLRGTQSQPDAELTVVALHGWLDNCLSFKPLSELLPDLNVIAFDLPGHGESQHLPVGMTYDFHYYLIWLHEVLEALALERVILLGHSMGAVIASLYAGVFPDRLSRLILIEGIGPMSVDEAEAPEKMKTYIQSWSKHRLMRNGLFASWEEAVRARQKAGKLRLESAQLLATRGAQEMNPGVMWKHDPRLKLPSRYQFSEAQTLAFLRQINCPALHIRASDSILPEPTLMSPRKAAISQLHEVLLEGGHHLHLDEPEPTAHVISQFLRQNS